MFGKNYDKEIKMLMDNDVKRLEQIIELKKDILKSTTDSNQQLKDMIDLATNVATQKQCITFLLNHASVDEDSKEDFMKMMTEIKKTQKMSKPSQK